MREFAAKLVFTRLFPYAEGGTVGGICPPYLDRRPEMSLGPQVRLLPPQNRIEPLGHWAGPLLPTEIFRWRILSGGVDFNRESKLGNTFHSLNFGQVCGTSPHLAPDDFFLLLLIVL